MHILVDVLGWRLQFGMAAERIPTCDHEEQEEEPPQQGSAHGSGAYL